jgi:hypothetical protein
LVQETGFLQITMSPSKKRKYIYVIFFGLIASGKSSLSKQLSVLLKKDDWLVISSNDDVKKIKKLNTRLKRYFCLLKCLFFDKKTLTGLSALFLLFLEVKPTSRLELKIYFNLLRGYLIRRRFFFLEDYEIITWENKFHVFPVFKNFPKQQEKIQKILLRFIPKDHNVIICNLKTNQNDAYYRFLGDDKRFFYFRKFFLNEIKKLYDRNAISNSKNIEKALCELSEKNKNIQKIDLSGKNHPKENAKKIFLFIKKNYSY